ncbi:MAG: hypothetical protein IJ224_06670 [Lachnospiraceae bacterium]|nr:hypothetical protein [Lachnospiraceae bacterium]
METIENLREKAIKEYEAVYNEIYERYKFKDERFLKMITQTNGHTEIAERVASDILSSDREEYKKEMQRRKESIIKKNKDSICI